MIKIKYFIFIFFLTNLFAEEKTETLKTENISEIRKEYSLVQKNLKKYKQTKIKFKHKTESELMVYFPGWLFF